MSVVIAIKDKERNCIYVGCDKQVTCGNNKKTLKGECQKVWHFNELPDIILGGCGSLRDIQILQTSPDLLDLTHIVLNQINYPYLVQNFFTKEFELLAQKNRIPKDEQGNLENSVGCSIILAVEDRMYEIDQEGTVMESEDYLVIGSGSDVAIGVLENNKSKKPITRIKEAIKACSDRTVYVNDKILIGDTKGYITEYDLAESEHKDNKKIVIVNNNK